MGISKREVSAGAWSGSRVELRRLLQEIQDAIESVREPLRSALVEEHNSRITQYEGWVREHEEWLVAHPIASADARDRIYHEQAFESNAKVVNSQKALRDAMVEQFEKSWGLRLNIEDHLGKEEESHYNIDPLLEAIDPRTVRTISILAPSGHSDGAHEYAVSISTDTNGLKLSVESPSRDFTLQTLARIKEELRRGRPWWFWLSNFWTTWTVSATVFSAAYLGLSFDFEGETAESLLPTVILALITGLGLGGILAIGLRTALPAFQVLTDQGRARGAAAIGWILTMLASIPIGLLVNYLSAS